MDADARRAEECRISEEGVCDTHPMNGARYCERGLADAVAQAVEERDEYIEDFKRSLMSISDKNIQQAEEIARLTGNLGFQQRLATQLEKAALYLLAENDRLRAALQAIIDASDGCIGHRNCNHSMDGWRLAREALR